MFFFSLFLKGFAEEIFHTNDLKAQEIFKDDFVLVKVDLLQIHYKRKKVCIIFILSLKKSENTFLLRIG